MARSRPAARASARRPAAKKNWIQKAVRHPGRFTAYCKRKGYGSATVKCAREVLANKSATRSLKSAAALSLRFEKGMGKGGRR